MVQDSSNPRAILFDKYEMGRLLGKGTFAKVYHARHLPSSSSVAIKVIQKDQIRRDAYLCTQIEREISVMSLVRHPNVVELKEVLATRSKIYLVMEYVRGGELFGRVARGKLSESQSRKLFHQLVSAVDHCHSRGVFHRDLKLENLLLDENGDLKVSDFGLAALPEQRRHDGLLHTRCGTPAYVAPEVLRRKGYDGAKADVWSCGVILFTLMAGFLSFQDENLMKMYEKIFKGEFRIPPWLSPDARRLVGRLLVVDPEKRLSIAEIAEVPWFKRGGSSCACAQALREQDLVEEEGSSTSPRFYNAFELISTLSSGFDLSSMFESGRRNGTAFMSKKGVEVVLEGLEKVGLGLGFGVWRAKDGCKVRMEGKGDGGRKERLVVTAEVFEVAEELTVVEFCKDSGDTMDYVQFCKEDVRPGLKDIVWTWQGDDLADMVN